ncbi:MAG: hypothetical protein DRN06_02515 [Thermoprotei archaeon]|nr:MAG: hypothetical protein DRN06_02515 [Thermoprotei archaeon]
MSKNPSFYGHRWIGALPSSYILSTRRFKKVVLEPPDYNPGSWIGAGNAILHEGEFLLAARPRKWPERGFAANVYASRNGEDYTLRSSISKEELAEMAGTPVRSIEGLQLLVDPYTQNYRLYVSVDATEVRGWDTVLLESDDPAGPWEFKGFVLRRGRSYDSREARDATITVIDGLYVALYKANDGSRVNMALAVSHDGVEWEKLGLLKLDGRPQPGYLLLYGTVLPGIMAPILYSFETVNVVKGAALSKIFASYLLDLRDMNLVTLHKAPWTPMSEFEREDYPVHTYVDLLYDSDRSRLLVYLEAVDPKYSKEPGLNLEVDRLILYEVKL